MTPPAGWYPAADGSVRMQWWNGASWTESFETPIGADLARFPNQAGAPPVLVQPEVARKPKISVFNGTKLAREYEAENERLTTLVAEHGLLDIAELDALKAAYGPALAEAVKAHFDK